MAHVHVSTISVFDVERITVRWIAEHNHYDVVFEAATEHGVTTINAWGGSGEGAAPELIVERAPERGYDGHAGAGEDAPIEPPRVELDL